MAVIDDEILAARDQIAAQDGLLLGPDGAATAAGYGFATAEGLVCQDDDVVLFGCAFGLKYPMPQVESTSITTASTINRSPGPTECRVPAAR